IPINGGGGSSRKKSVESNKGPIKTILIGNIIVDTVFFQTIGDAVPRKESGCLGKPLGPVDPKSEVVIKRKANPEMMKRITNFVLEMFIYCELYHLFLVSGLRDQGSPSTQNFSSEILVWAQPRGFRSF